MVDGIERQAQLLQSLPQEECVLVFGNAKIPLPYTNTLKSLFSLWIQAPHPFLSQDLVSG